MQGMAPVVLQKVAGLKAGAVAFLRTLPSNKQVRLHSLQGASSKLAASPALLNRLLMLLLLIIFAHESYCRTRLGCEIIEFMTAYACMVCKQHSMRVARLVSNK